ncbi:hypothetical protein BH11ACT8_BH11ACT8_18840 [soil metagenome]
MPKTGEMFHRHPFLSLVTFAYLGLVGLVTLTPVRQTPRGDDLVSRILARLEGRPGLEWLTFDRAEFLANIAMFVPVGLFLLLLVGTRFWWVAVGVGFAMTAAIETAQRSIPGRVSDPRDLVANTAGAVLGVLVGLVLTYPKTRRRGTARREAMLSR